MKRVAMVVVSASVVAGCSAGDASPVPRDSARGVPADPAVPTVVAESIAVDAPAAFPAQLHVEHDAWVVARAAGVVEALDADLGSGVAAGAPLARIEAADQRLALERATLEQAAAERGALRARALTRAGGVTAADSEQVEFALRRAEVALAEARRALALTNVVAPFAGTVSARRARAGQLVRPGDTLFRVTQAAPLLARVHVPEATAMLLRPGAAARVSAPGGAATTASVLRLAPAVDAASGTREVVLRVAPRAGLLPGSGVLVRLGAERRRALAVPRAAVSADGYALVVGAGRPTLRAVLAGDTLPGGLLEVTGGLVAGERVARRAP